MLDYSVQARRIDESGSVATSKRAEVWLDTGMKGREDAFNPAELLLTSLAACMIKGIERVMPMIKFELRGVEAKRHGTRQDSPPKLVTIDYKIIVDTDEADHRLDLLHKNARKFGTISNTLADALKLEGVIVRTTDPLVRT